MKGRATGWQPAYAVLALAECTCVLDPLSADIHPAWHKFQWFYSLLVEQVGDNYGTERVMTGVDSTESSCSTLVVLVKCRACASTLYAAGRKFSFTCSILLGVAVSFGRACGFWNMLQERSAPQAPQEYKYL